MNKYESIDPDGNISPGSSFTQGKSELGKHEIVTVKDIDHPLLKHPIETITFKLPPKGKLISLTFFKMELSQFTIYNTTSTKFKL